MYNKHLGNRYLPVLLIFGCISGGGGNRVATQLDVVAASSAESRITLKIELNAVTKGIK
jgi:hypothetical protein